ncbi:O-antigen ligase family protein [Leifsonia sp. H3M29-4]|uniref:O-antigen ligase family protein n=1 Tax=Salinibacterium metalliresistens TaxID=3031321 RepID=UPI0023DA2EB5|nr:O-antigen ligase family protein [Salinibacterium metalliresistens]MDF1479175.1 O-antigen ligase family protein [Salinibacterium metalliresistens]
MDLTPRSGTRAALESFLADPRLSSALSFTIITATIAADPVRRLIGWPGYGAALVVLVLLAGASLFARRGTLEWRGLLPVSLLVFVGWCGLTILWTAQQWSALGGVAHQVAVAFLAVYVALVRDLIQVIRDFGDVLRGYLAISLALEIFAGLLIDQPIEWLGIDGDLAAGGPIQGLAGNRNQLGLIAVIALITFAIETNTRSIPTMLGVFSLIGATATLLLTGSPVAIGTALAVAIATGVILALRTVPDSRRRFWDIAVAAVAVVAIIVVFASRQGIVRVLSAATEVESRLELWRSLGALIPFHQLEGWGWVGIWRADQTPYAGLGVTEGLHGSALNAYVDVVFQAGLVGLFAFIVLVGLGFVRSWLVATRRKTVSYLWPALVMVALLVTSLAESSVLVDFGWLTLVVCITRAAQTMSWRSAWMATQSTDLPRGR